MSPILGAMEPKRYAIINLVHVIKHVHATVLEAGSGEAEAGDPESPGRSTGAPIRVAHVPMIARLALT
jgi:hypothetical protein